MEFLFDRKCDLNYSQQFLIKFYEGLKKKTAIFLIFLQLAGKL